MALYKIDGREVVRFSGPDAHKLLNDTLTCRFDASLTGTARWFALLSPQGKVQVEGLVTAAGDAFYADVEAGLAADFIKKMKLYRLRAKVEIEQTGHAVHWSLDGEEPQGTNVIATCRDERSPALGVRFITAGVGENAVETDANQTQATALVAAGIPEFGPGFTANDVFPHDIGMDLLNGIDFKKGCYIGQEVVSRMQHRRTARRRPVLVSALPAATAAGAPVIVGEREAGTLGPVVDRKAVAILRLDRIPAADAATVGGLPVKLSLPAWATYGFGESGSAE